MQRAKNFPTVFFLFLCGALAQVPAYGQELRTNAAGEKIIVYRDGTARYFNDLQLIDAQQKDSAAAAYPVVAVRIEPLSGGVDPTEDDLRRIAQRKLQLARQAEELARARATAATNGRLDLERQLAAARTAGRREQAGALQRRLQLATNVENKALEDRRDAEERAAAAALVVSEGRYVEAYNQARRLEREGPEPPKPATRTERNLKMLLPVEPAFTGYGTARGRLPVAEGTLCGALPGQQRPNGPSPLSRPSLLFTYTDENLRPFLDGKEYLRCHAYVSRDARGDRYLHLQLNFANRNALSSYGFLAENSSLSLHLLNGRHLSLQAAALAVGIIDHGKRELNYHVRYRLPRGAAQELSNQALDYVRIFWSGGYEEYPIYQVDALRRMMECF